MKNTNSLSAGLQKINSFFLDTLFPVTCLLCRKEDIWLCEECANELPLLSFQLCPYCEREIVQNGLICEQCKNRQFEKNSSPSLIALICAMDYRLIAKFVHLFKYNFVFDLGVPLGKIIARALQKNELPLPDFIIPIPIHTSKLKWRGFNQAEILADSVSQNLVPGFSLSVRSDLVFRQKKTHAQMKIKTHSARLDNLRDAFALTPEAKNNLVDKKILLIDDIATTGATLFECAKVLKSAGAKEVYGAIIARQKIG